MLYTQHKFLLWGLFLCCFPVWLNAQSALTKADSLLQAKQYEAAYQLASNHLKQYPDNDTALAVQAECLIFMKRPGEAFKMLNTVIQRNARFNRAYYVRAVMMFLAGNVEEAKNDLNMAARNLTDTLLAAKVYKTRSGLHFETMNYPSCIADAIRSLQYKQDDVDALNNLGLCLGETGKFDSAQVCFMMAHRLDSLNQMTLNNIGYNYVRSDRFDDAIRWLDKALKIDPKDPFALNNRGFARYKLGETDAAFIDVDKSISVYNSNPYAFRNRALIYIAKAEYKKACMDLDKAIHLGFREKYGEDVDQLKKEYCK